MRLSLTHGVPGSQLQDRVASLEAEKAVLAAAAGSDAPPGPGSSGEETTTTSSPAFDRLRLELAEALRSQGQLQTRLNAAEGELEKLRAKTKLDTKTAKALTSERNTLATKVRDRDEELRGKSKLVEVFVIPLLTLCRENGAADESAMQDVQDELIALNLQLNVAEKQRAEVQAENKELIARWMQRKTQEAEAMNMANEPIFAKGR